MKDLRIEKGLSLQELSEQTGISRASLGNYETDDYKEITHKAIVTLANFYGVTSDYLLGLTENREQHRFPIDDLGLDDEDYYMKTLATASISEDNYFNNLLGNDIVKIAKDLRDAHSKDAETGDATTPVDDILDSFEELKTADNATQAQMIMYSKLFKINFTKMDPYEFKTFTNILQRYSDLCKPVKGTGRGKKKK